MGHKTLNDWWQSRIIQRNKEWLKIVLSNESGEAESTASLTVKKALVAPKIVKALEDQIVAKGASLIFEVKVEGEPTDVRWSKDGTPLSASANIKMDKIDDQTSVEEALCLK